MATLTMEVRGKDYPVELTSYGIFVVTMDGDRYSAETYEGLRAKLMGVTRRKSYKVSIPFCELVYAGYGQDRHAEIRNATATGIHAKTRAVLIRWEDTGRADTIEGYNAIKMEPLSAEDGVAYIRLTEAHAAAQHALTEFRQAHKIDLRDAIRDAIEAQEEARKETGTDKP
jgi:hypothetical protein